MRTLPPLKSLRVFEATARALSFTRAALELNVTQGAVSRQIKSLEDYLGTPLFVRHARSLSLTEAGAALLPEIAGAFDTLESALDSVKSGDSRTTLHILSPPTLASRWLASRLGDFHDRFPDFSLVLLDRDSDRELADCEIRFGREANTRCHSENLFLETHVPVCAPPLLDAAQDMASQQKRLLHVRHQGKPLPIWSDWFVAAGIGDRVNPAAGITYSTLEQVINAAKAGSGFAVIDRRMIADELAQGSLLQFSPVETTGPYGYWLDVPKSKLGLSKVDRFTDWLRGMCQ